MAKGNRGGRRGASAASPFAATFTVTQAPPPQPQPPQLDDQQPQPTPAPAQQSGPSGVRNFQSMTDDQKADAIIKGIKTDIPDHLNKSSDLQRFLYHIGSDEKPNAVDSKTLAGLPGTTIYRTVDAVYNPSIDVNFTAPQIAKQIRGAKVTRVSSGGRAVYGEGLYFATTSNSSQMYGSTSGNINKTCMITAKLSPSAKIINSDSAERGAQREISRGTKLGKALARCSNQARTSIYALAKGYDVIKASYANYYNVVNRGVLSISDQIRAI